MWPRNVTAAAPYRKVRAGFPLFQRRTAAAGFGRAGRARSWAAVGEERRTANCGLGRVPPLRSGPGCARSRPRYDCGQLRRAAGARGSWAIPRLHRARAAVSALRARIPHASRRFRATSCRTAHPRRGPQPPARRPARPALIRLDKPNSVRGEAGRLKPRQQRPKVRLRGLLVGACTWGQLRPGRRFGWAANRRGAGFSRTAGFGRTAESRPSHRFPVGPPIPGHRLPPRRRSPAAPPIPRRAADPPPCRRSPAVPPIPAGWKPAGRADRADLRHPRSKAVQGVREGGLGAVVAAVSTAGVHTELSGREGRPAPTPSPPPRADA